MKKYTQQELFEEWATVGKNIQELNSVIQNDLSKASQDTGFQLQKDFLWDFETHIDKLFILKQRIMSFLGSIGEENTDG